MEKEKVGMRYYITITLNTNVERFNEEIGAYEVDELDDLRVATSQMHKTFDRLIYAFNTKKTDIMINVELWDREKDEIIDSVQN